VTTIHRLHLAWLYGPGWDKTPVHGFVVEHSDGVILVDTGVGEPGEVLGDWRIVNRSMADALAEIDLSPVDVSLVINTHLHFDHCGQNAVFAHAPFFVQRAELDRARREEPEVAGWFDFAGARFELLDGDSDIVPGVRVIATPGHTLGHQSVVVDVAGNEEVMIGDAAYTSEVFANPAVGADLPGQAADELSWRASLQRVSRLQAARVHFCHDVAIVDGRS
jgi:N-acyl homoserine lactone hydrolase